MGAALPSFSRKGMRRKSHHCFSLSLVLLERDQLTGPGAGGDDREWLASAGGEGEARSWSTVTINVQGDDVCSCLQLFAD